LHLVLGIRFSLINLDSLLEQVLWTTSPRQPFFAPHHLCPQLVRRLSTFVDNPLSTFAGRIAEPAFFQELSAARSRRGTEE
jgi:hypothetical protein